MQRRLARLGWLLSTPSFVVVLGVTIFPIVVSMILGFNEARIAGTGLRLGDWSTANYELMFGSDIWRYAIVFTILYTIVSVAVQLVLGTVSALILERLSGARGWLMALLLLPWSMITVTSAELWSYIYNATYGIATFILTPVLGEGFVILGTAPGAIVALIVADTWKTTPLVTIIVLAGLVMIPREIYEASKIDGANSWATFWRITLPLLRPTVAIAVLFRILQAFGLFDLPFVITSGGPGHSTQSVALLAWSVLFKDLNIGAGSAVATSTAVIVLVVCLVFLRAFRTQVGREELS